MGLENRTDPRVLQQRKREHIAHIVANGSYYISDCHPWEIKEGCPREDCPMRWVAAIPEPQETDYVFKCNPTGSAADILILLERTQPALKLNSSEHREDD